MRTEKAIIKARTDWRFGEGSNRELKRSLRRARRRNARQIVREYLR